MVTACGIVFWPADGPSDLGNGEDAGESLGSGMMAIVTSEEPLVCSNCGRPVDPDRRELDYRFKLPDALFAIPESERSDRIRGLGSDMVGAPDVGIFVRVLLPVTLSDGYSIRYGTWLGLTSRENFERARDLWHAPEYPSLTLTGILGNAIEPWGEPLMTRVGVGVRAAHEVPYVEAFKDPEMGKVLTETWSRSWVLSAIPTSAWHGHIHD
jgi:hypothetical protein